MGSGPACLEKWDFDAAIAELTEAIRLAPTYTKAYESRGEAYAKKGDKAKAKTDLEQAIAAYTEIIRLDPKNAETYYNRGRGYGNAG